MPKRTLMFALGSVAALVYTATAAGHAGISPPVVKAGAFQQISLTVPTEEENASTTAVEITIPDGVTVGGFEPTPGWKRDVVATGSGEDRRVERVTWTGGSVPADESAVFRFSAGFDDAKDYAFPVKQTYSSGKVVDWSGPEDADEPAPIVEASSDLGSGGGSSTLDIIAIVVGGVALIVAVAALLGGRRALT